MVEITVYLWADNVGNPADTLELWPAPTGMRLSYLIWKLQGLGLCALPEWTLAQLWLGQLQGVTHTPGLPGDEFKASLWGFLLGTGRPWLPKLPCESLLWERFLRIFLASTLFRFRVPAGEPSPRRGSDIKKGGDATNWVWERSLQAPIVSGCLIFSFLSFSLSLLDMKIKAMVVERKSARVGAGEVSFVKVQSRKCSSWPRGKKKKQLGHSSSTFTSQAPAFLGLDSAKRPWNGEVWLPVRNEETAPWRYF